MLITGGPAGSALFQRLHDVSRATLSEMIAAGSAVAGVDPEARAAFLLVNDLAAVILRARLTEVLGVDPLSPDGLNRWDNEVLAVYRGGLLDGAEPRTASDTFGADLRNEPDNGRHPQ